MSLLRPLLFVLLLLNLLALASGLGWLGRSTVPGEPERLTNQINPELIVLLAPAAQDAPLRPAAPAAPQANTLPPEHRATVPQPLPERREPAAPHIDAASPDAASVAATAPRVAPQPPPACVAYGRLSLDQADTIERVAQSLDAELALTRETVEAPGGWWVRLPPHASLQAAERRARALRALGVRDLFIIRETGPNQFAISLGLFRSESGARQHLADLRSRKVEGVEITVRNPAVFRVEVRGPATRVDALSGQVANRLPQAAPSGCNP